MSTIASLSMNTIATMAMRMFLNRTFWISLLVMDTMPHNLSRRLLNIAKRIFQAGEPLRVCVISTKSTWTPSHHKILILVSQYS